MARTNPKPDRRGTGDVDAVLRNAAERIFTAIAARDVKALRAELTDDFAHTSVGGAEQNRDVFLEAIRTMPYGIAAIQGEGVHVRPMGDVAVMSGIQRARVTLQDGSAASASTAFVDLFVRGEDGRWRLRHAWSVELPVEQPT